ncbi:MAG: hypothetical protein HGGPFJEG_00876 [Ignavibacteria bacterium]|nr:hypothetical protein [Ignavibacteria bacterium]
MKKKKKQNIEAPAVKPSKSSNFLMKVKPVYMLLLAAILPLITAFVYFNYVNEHNNFLSFPLDDSWIHLTFARNISEYFSFSYYKDELVTAGSTSPLYTIILAIGFFIYKNEMILSYVIGVLCFSASAFYFYKLTIRDLRNSSIFAFAVTLIFIFDKWINFISLSGMETIMFIMLLIICAYLYKTKNAFPFAITAGLILWTRPDGIAFIAALALTYLTEMFFAKRNPEIKLFSKKQLINILIIYFILTGMYFMFNYFLSGSILPNTYSAKVAYFIDTEKRLDFLQDKVWMYFTNGYYSIIMIGFVFAIIKLIVDFSRKKYNQNTLYIVFIFTFILLYTIKLPAINRFGRYVMPLIPFFILASMTGFRDMIETIVKLTKIPITKTILYIVLIPIVYYLCYSDFKKNKSDLSKYCNYIYSRQIQAAYWLKEHTEENDIIATHDIGAIGYYSGRKLVDVAGLVNLELNEKLNDYNYSQIMENYCINHGVTYLAFLNNWYTISNQSPVFSTNEGDYTEVMGVFRFSPGKTHILSKEAHNILSKIGKVVKEKNADSVILLSDKALKLEPYDSYAYFFRAVGYFLKNDIVNYEKDILHSLELFPESKFSNQNYANFLFNNKRFEEAKKVFSKLTNLDPANKNFATSLKAASDSALHQKMISEINK